jgi:hypothetical protein
MKMSCCLKCVEKKNLVGIFVQKLIDQITEDRSDFRNRGFLLRSLFAEVVNALSDIIDDVEENLTSPQPTDEELEVLGDYLIDFQEIMTKAIQAASEVRESVFNLRLDIMRMKTALQNPGCQSDKCIKDVVAKSDPIIGYLNEFVDFYKQVNDYANLIESKNIALVSLVENGGTKLQIEAAVNEIAQITSVNSPILQDILAVNADFFPAIEEFLVDIVTCPGLLPYASELQYTKCK